MIGPREKKEITNARRAVPMDRNIDHSVPVWEQEIRVEKVTEKYALTFAETKNFDVGSFQL